LGKTAVVFVECGRFLFGKGGGLYIATLISDTHLQPITNLHETVAKQHATLCLCRLISFSIFSFPRHLQEMADVLVSCRVDGGEPYIWEATFGRAYHVDKKDRISIKFFRGVRDSGVCFAIYKIAQTNFHSDEARKQRRPVEKMLKTLEQERDVLMAQVTEFAQLPASFVTQCGNNAIQIKLLTDKLRDLPVGQPIACSFGTQLTAPTYNELALTFEDTHIDLKFEFDTPNWSSEGTISFVCEPEILDKDSVSNALRKQGFRSAEILEATLLNSDAVWSEYTGDACFADPKELPECVFLA